MKKALSLSLLIALSLSLFSACATKPDILINEEDSLDFAGGKVVIAVSDCIHDFPPQKGGTASEDRLLDRLAETEKKFNLEFDYMKNINPSTTFLSGAFSGGLQADLLYTCNKQLHDAYQINTILPAENVISDPESEKWASPAIAAKGLYGGKIYGIFPNYWEFAPDILGLLNTDMDILSEYQIDDPHEIIEAGEWNWDNFREFLRKTTFTDGERKYVGMDINRNGVASLFPFVLSNGGSFITQSNGRTVLNINSPEAAEAYEFIAGLGADGLIVETYDSSEVKTVTSSGGPQTSEEINIAQFRFPYGPKGNKDTVSTLTTDIRLWAFPIFSVYTEEEIGELAEFMFEPLSKSFPNGWKDTVNDNIFYYESEFEYYLKGVEQSEYIDMYIFIDSFTLYSKSILEILRNDQSSVNAIDSIYEVISKDIDEHYNK